MNTDMSVFMVSPDLNHAQIETPIKTHAASHLLVMDLRFPLLIRAHNAMYSPCPNISLAIFEQLSQFALLVLDLYDLPHGALMLYYCDYIK